MSCTRPPSSGCTISWPQSPTGSTAGSSPASPCAGRTAPPSWLAAPCACSRRGNLQTYAFLFALGVALVLYLVLIDASATHYPPAEATAAFTRRLRIRISAFLRPSDFGLRFPACPSNLHHLLSAAAALLLAFVPRSFRVVMRGVAVLATLVSALLAVIMFLQFNGADVGASGYQFEQQIAWVSALGISYHVGVDGINVGLVLMGAIVAFAAACVSWEIKEREKEFYILLLVMAGGILGAFASLDLFFFYFFHELALVPTFIMIGVWGRGEQKNYATFQITLYLSIGGVDRAGRPDRALSAGWRQHVRHSRR